MEILASTGKLLLLTSNEDVVLGSDEIFTKFLKQLYVLSLILDLPRKSKAFPAESTHSKIIQCTLSYVELGLFQLS